jgi:hypothetical protein
LASAIEVSPSSVSVALALFTYGASPTNACGHAVVSSVGATPCSANHESGGCWMAGMGRPNWRANSKSRWSPLGTAMIAPVP